MVLFCYIYELEVLVLVLNVVFIIVLRNLNSQVFVMSFSGFCSVLVNSLILYVIPVLELLLQGLCYGSKVQ